MYLAELYAIVNKNGLNFKNFSKKDLELILRIFAL